MSARASPRWGLRAATELYVDGMILIPHASAAWQHAFNDGRGQCRLGIQLRRRGASRCRGLPIARDAAMLEAGIMLKVAEDATLGLSYQGQIGSDVDDHGLSGRVDWRF